MTIKDIPPWELLQKKMTWEQLKFIHNKKVLDFGSGNGMTADHFAIDNDVIAIEPDEKMLWDRFAENDYIQIKGDNRELKNFEDESFDVILCHNVFEYAGEREKIIKEFSRILKTNGYLSILKHNRAGRVMQMVVLLNNFEHAYKLLEGKNGNSQQFGKINYYEDTEILEWSDKFKIERTLGMRTFWDLQQNQEIHKDKTWQEQMLKMELLASELEEYKAIASFHHVILRKK
ncbi:methyltransferase domain-containing protein [Alkaliphilus peptidifermentans]|uniref:Methyltransferase domain-containing protein n=1 Tax=Alkaliphilus peptidifermentans DSM 18978 TaxID=1120976 RepID=A0A1G5LFT3_9FIRM|nr:methyltransferase domain-containing protein [Alkaliphilus peptidifermentans]SCZ11029.1 Methyltransferase domain-containing protein [Alkaliphilus peptidifermentans DSM 18978]